MREVRSQVTLFLFGDALRNGSTSRRTPWPPIKFAGLVLHLSSRPIRDMIRRESRDKTESSTMNTERGKREQESGSWQTALSEHVSHFRWCCRIKSRFVIVMDRSGQVKNAKSHGKLRAVNMMCLYALLQFRLFLSAERDDVNTSTLPISQPHIIQ